MRTHRQIAHRQNTRTGRWRAAARARTVFNGNGMFTLTVRVRRRRRLSRLSCVYAICTRLVVVVVVASVPAA